MWERMYLVINEMMYTTFMVTSLWLLIWIFFFFCFCCNQFSSVTQSCLTLCNAMNYGMPGFPTHHQLPEFPEVMSIELVMPSNHLILCQPLLLPLSIFPNIRVFSDESAHQVAKGLEFQLQHQSPIFSVQFSSVTQSCPTLCDPMNRSMLGLPVHHKLT